ncbi:hypothetical protein ACFL02_03340 [Planctomycetota bacterium]
MAAKNVRLGIGVLFCLIISLVSSCGQEQITPPIEQTGLARITTPMEQLGHNVGDDYFLANYAQLVEYWQKLAQQSDRMILEEVGETEEGRPMYLAVITSPENHKRLDHYKEISRRLCLAEGLTEIQARELAQEGKAGEV